MTRVAPDPGEWAIVERVVDLLIEERGWAEDPSDPFEAWVHVRASCDAREIFCLCVVCRRPIARTPGATIDAREDLGDLECEVTVLVGFERVLFVSGRDPEVLKLTRRDLMSAPALPSGDEMRAVCEAHCLQCALQWWADRQ